jgi:hypothetical protein
MIAAICRRWRRRDDLDRSLLRAGLAFGFLVAAALL